MATQLSIAILFLCLFVPFANAQMVVNHLGPQSDRDKRFEYDNAILRLALEHSRDEFGAYVMIPITGIGYDRAAAVARDGQIKNFIYKDSASNERVQKFGYVNFPVDLGIVGYRVFLTNPVVNNNLLEMARLQSLQMLNVLQGSGWLDTEILRSNGFNVSVGSDYDGLFSMINSGRAEVFPRGANEVYLELQKQKPSNPNLVLNPNIALYYPLPRFFFTNAKNKQLIKRVRVGLKRAFENGEIHKAWHKHYSQSLELVKLKERKVYKLNNPYISEVSTQYQQYIYIP